MGPEQLAFDWGAEPDPQPQQPQQPLPERPMPQIRPLADRLTELARRGIRLGTSSWKYPGWIGTVYCPDRYLFRGKLSRRRFEQTCLAEYATIFPTVGGDFSFYQFLSAETWGGLFAQLPDGFGMSLKIPEEITVTRFPDLPRYGRRAGADNPHFMDTRLLERQFLAPLEPYREKLGVLMFEFGCVHEGPLHEPGRFVAALDAFLARLPTDRFRFAVEVRNREFLKDPTDYLGSLKAHNVAHCFSSWTRMPSVVDQLRMPGALTARHVAARFLLKPGRSYQQAVDLFSPYERLREPYPEGRAGLRELIERCLDQGHTLFAFVNNRFEGNAVETLRAVTDDHI